MSERIAPEVAQRLMGEATQGPWSDCAIQGREWNADSDYDGRQPSGWGRMHVAGADGEVVALVVEIDGGMPCDANRRLIAAAPDLAHTVVLQAAEIAALRSELAAARVGVVTVEAHARAVRNMLIAVATAYRAASGCHGVEATRVANAAWLGSMDRADLIATLTRSGVPHDRAVALADGAE